REVRFRGLGDRGVALPALVLELDVLNRHRVGVGVVFRQGLIFRYPAAIDLVGDRELAGFVVELDQYVLAEARKRDFRAERAVEAPHLPGPQLELGVVGDAALQGDGVIFGAARRFAAARRVAAFAMRHHLGGALEHADFAHAGYIFAVP